MRAIIVNPTTDRDLELYHLGAAGVASFLNAGGRHQAEVVDFTFFWDHWISYFRERLERFRPHVIGISTVTPRMPSVRKIAQVAKVILPGVKVVLGGHHASLDTARTVKLPEVDFAVVGEGEYVFHALLDALEDGGGTAEPARLRAIPSLAWAEGDDVVETALGPLPKGPKLDMLPPNDWRLWEQHGRMIYHAGFLPMIGVRGCPYKCSFCSSPILADRLEGTGPFVRKRDAAAVAEEAAVHWERHHHQGLRYINFYDQNFLMYRNWLEDFTRAYRALGMHTKLPFTAYSRVDHITDEKLALAASAGCFQLRLGIEAGDPEVRNQLLNKSLDQGVLYDKLKLIRKHGIKTLGYFLIGAPGETTTQANTSFRVARETGLDRAAFFFFTPLYDLPITRETPQVDYLKRTESGGFYKGGDLTEQGTEIPPLRLKSLFFRSNGYYLAKTTLQQLRHQGPRWVARFPSYWKKAQEDGLDAKITLSQYVFYHGDAYQY